MLTPKQVAAKVQVSVSLVYQWVKTGRVECLRLGGRGKRGKVLIFPESLDRFLESCKQQAKPSLSLRHINL
jgi:excisionase family DNA binding protein